jgi:dienelactone hydrolase
VAEQFALIDLDTGQVTTLLDAPIGRALLFYAPQKAVWSHDGRRVLLVNTFLPLEGVNEVERSKRSERPCVALVDVARREAVCVAPVNQSAEDTRNLQKGTTFHSLIDVNWGADEGVVMLRYYAFANGDDERDDYPPEAYRLEKSIWKLTDASSAVPAVLKSLESLKASKLLSLSIHEELNSPQALYITDPNSRQSKELWNPNPKLTAVSLGDASIYRWKDKSGREWVGGLVKPPDYEPGHKYPLVIQTHGFDRHRFMAVGAYTSANAARPMAAKGIMVLQVPDSHDGFLTAKEPLVHLEGFVAAIDQMTAEGLIDPNRVGIIGFSRTCFYVLVALEKDPNRFKAATVADGTMFGYMQYLVNVDNPAGGEQFKKQVADIIGDQPFGDGLGAWLRQSPGFKMDEIRAPVRVEAYGNYSLVLNWESYAGLRMQNKPVDLIFFPDAHHVLTRPQELFASEQGNVDWFCFWLKGEEDPDPAKANQYARWRELRKLQDQKEKKASPPAK